MTNIIKKSNKSQLLASDIINVSYSPLPPTSTLSLQWGMCKIYDNYDNNDNRKVLLIIYMNIPTPLNWFSNEETQRHRFLLYKCRIKVDFFRIKRQTRTYSEKSFLSILIIKKLRACTCLSNTYITYTWVVMPFSLLIEQKSPIAWNTGKNMYVLCTTHVRVSQTRTCI